MPVLEPMAVIDMCVAAEHLAVDVTDVAWKCGWETRSFAEPGVLVVASGWLQGRSVCAECVGWETCWVGDFAGDPALDICYVLVCWDTDSLLVLVEPSVCDAAVMLSASSVGSTKVTTYGPAVMAGHVCTLHSA